MHLIPFTQLEQSDIKDIRYVKYKILAYEVEHKINGLETFDKFLKKQIVFDSPNYLQHKGRQRKLNTKINETVIPNPKIRDNLPKI